MKIRRIHNTTKMIKNLILIKTVNYLPIFNYYNYSRLALLFDLIFLNENTYTMTYIINLIVNQLNINKGFNNNTYFLNNKTAYNHNLILWLSLYLFLKNYLFWKKIQLLTCEIRMMSHTNQRTFNTLFILFMPQTDKVTFVLIAYWVFIFYVVQLLALNITHLYRFFNSFIYIIHNRYTVMGRIKTIKNGIWFAESQIKRSVLDAKTVALNFCYHLFYKIFKAFSWSNWHMIILFLSNHKLILNSKKQTGGNPTKIFKRSVVTGGVNNKPNKPWTRNAKEKEKVIRFCWNFLLAYLICIVPGPLWTTLTWLWETHSVYNDIWNNWRDLLTNSRDFYFKGQYQIREWSELMLMNLLAHRVVTVELYERLLIDRYLINVEVVIVALNFFPLVVAVGGLILLFPNTIVGTLTIACGPIIIIPAVWAIEVIWLITFIKSNKKL